MKVIYTLLIILIPFVGFGQYTYIPDNNFEQTLIDAGYDNLMDNYALTSTISNIQYLNLTTVGNGVNDLTGLEDFISLTHLTLKTWSANAVSVQLDLSNHPLLEHLSLSVGESLGHLDFSNHLNLKYVGIFPNSFGTTSINSINLSNCPNLLNFSFGLNYAYDLTLDSLDISNCTNLNFSGAGSWDGNQHDLSQLYLRYLDASNCSSLEHLVVKDNNLYSYNPYYTPDSMFLDVSNCSSLQTLDCSNHDIYELNISNCSSLQTLDCSQNNLKDLDLSTCSSLVNLNCMNNELSYFLDLSNIYNINTLNCSDAFYYGENMDSLFCIKVHSIPYYQNLGINVIKNIWTNFTTTNITIEHVTACDSYSWNGITFTESGTYKYGTNDCSSLATLNLIINNSSYSYENLSMSDSSFWNGQWYNQNGVYTYQTLNAVGCDSVAYLNLGTYVPDANFEQALINLGYDDVLDQHVVTSNINMVTELDVSGLGIEDLTGIEDFSDLQTLNCSFNSLDSINLSNNNNLNYLNAEQNPELFYLNIMNTNISLTSLGVNPFYNLDLDNSLSNLTCISVDQDFLDSYDQIIEWPSTLCDATNTPGYWGIGADCVPFVSLESCNLGIPGCTDPDACNYDYPAFFDIIEDGSCEYGNDDPECWPGDCQDGVIINIPGCTDPEACNYKPCANEDDGSCTYTDGVCETCEYPSGYYSGGVIIDNDEDNDGICNDDEITGCTDVLACNYNPLAEFNDGSCTYIDGICETCEDGFVVDNDQDNDGVCDVDEVVGCQDIAACNYDELATDVGTCYYPSFSEVSISECGDSYDWNNETYTSSGIYTFTTVNSVGCDSIAYLDLNIYPNPVAQNIVGEINVEPFSTHIYAVELNDNTYTWNVTGGNIITINNNSVEIIWDNIGVGEIIVSEVNYAYCSTAHILDVNILQPIYGCTDELACNFNPNASVDDGSCYNLIASISQSGDSLIANILPSNTFHTVNWYNVQEVDGINKYWLMAENSSNFMPTFDCSYFIIANDENCSDTSSVYYYAEEARSIGKLTTSPNPSNGKVKVYFDNINNQFVRLYLMNNSGNILDEFLTKNNELEIDLSSYPSGAYHIIFNSPKSKGCLNEDTFQKVSNTIILNK